MNAYALLPTVRPNASPVTYGGLGQWASVISAGITAGVALTTTYFGWRQQSDAQKRAEHQAERDAAAQLELAKAAQAQQAAAAQTAAVQTATSGAQGASTSPVALMTAQALGSPMVLLGGVAVAAVLAFALMRGRR